jgi:multicomponent K+:H+ antiporter subunit D
MTKVGAYGIIRIYTLVFPPDLALTQGLFDTWLMPAALLTLALGMIGVLGARRIDKLVAFSVIGSMGMLLSAVAVFTPDGIVAALYYAIHSTFATAALFLLVDVLRDRRGKAGAWLNDAVPVAGGPLVAGMFFVAAIGMTGLPPLSGFVGKLLILDAARDSALVWWVWGTVLIGSLIAVVGFSRAGSQIFWRSHQVALVQADEAECEDEEANIADISLPQPALPMVAIGSLIALLVALTIFAGPVTRNLSATAAQLFAPEPYISAVLSMPGKVIKSDSYGDDHADDATEQTDEGGH